MIEKKLNELIGKLTNSNNTDLHYDDLLEWLDKLVGYKEALDNCDEGIIITCSNDLVFYHNDEALKILKVKNSLMGQKWQTMFKHKVPVALKKAIKEISSSYPSYFDISYEYEGEYFSYKTACYPKDFGFIFKLMPKKDYSLTFDEKSQKEATNLLFGLTYITEISGGNNEFIMDVLNTFIDQVPKELDFIEKCISENELNTISEMAHKLRPNFVLIDREDISDNWTKVEMITSEKEINKESTVYLISLINESRKVVNAVETYLSQC